MRDSGRPCIEDGGKLMVIGSTRAGNFSTFRSTAQKSFANVSPAFTRPRITFCQPGRDGGGGAGGWKKSSYTSRVTSGRDRQSCGSQMIRCVLCPRGKMTNRVAAFLATGNCGKWRGRYRRGSVNVGSAAGQTSPRYFRNCSRPLPRRIGETSGQSGDGAGATKDFVSG